MSSLDQLQAFVSAADHGSFSAAARQLGKAQSAVSTAVINLEIDTGVDLFDRSGLGEQIGAANMHRTILEAAPTLIARVSRPYCESQCEMAAFPDCTTT